MKYFKRHWDETSGDNLTNGWGTSWYYFEADEDGYVLRQLQQFENGQVLKYDDDYVEDEFGGLTDQPLNDEMTSFQIDKKEFEDMWLYPRYKSSV